MRDDEDPAAGVARGELGHTRNDACGHALVGLAVVPACVSVEPPAVGGRKARSDLFARQSGPGADVDLAERPDPVERQSVALGDGRGRFRRPAKIARVDGIELGIRELLGEGGGLTVSELGERPVGMSLPSTLDVPVALAVAREENGRRRHRSSLRSGCAGARGWNPPGSPPSFPRCDERIAAIAACLVHFVPRWTWDRNMFARAGAGAASRVPAWISDSRIASASSLVRPPGSGSRPHGSSPRRALARSSPAATVTASTRLARRPAPL